METIQARKGKESVDHLQLSGFVFPGAGHWLRKDDRPDAFCKDPSAVAWNCRKPQSKSFITGDTA